MRTKKPVEDFIRKCFYDFTPLVPTEEPTAPYSAKNLQMWRCPKCKTLWPWTRDPILNGAYAQYHQIERGVFSGISMLSDPECKVFDREAALKCHNKNKSRRTKPAAPTDAELKKREPIFAYADNSSKPTHRWHRGREEWIKLK